MARPNKQGLDYFPFDVDFFSDEKINAVSWEFGIKGEITAIKLLCAVYRNGYFIEWNDMLKFKLLKELPGISSELLDQIINRLVKWGFFNKDLFDSANVLTSRGIQRRYIAICSKMRRKNMLEQFSLLDADNQYTEDNSAKPKSNSNSRRTPQSISSDPVATVSNNTDNYYVSFADEVARMQKDAIWIEQGICMKYNIQPSNVSGLLKEFLAHCISECSEKPHKSYGDAKRHFSSWYRAGHPSKDSKSKQNVKLDSSADYTYSGGFGGEDV